MFLIELYIRAVVGLADYKSGGSRGSDTDSLFGLLFIYF